MCWSHQASGDAWEEWRCICLMSLFSTDRMSPLLHLCSLLSCENEIGMPILTAQLLCSHAVTGTRLPRQTQCPILSSASMRRESPVIWRFFFQFFSILPPPMLHPWLRVQLTRRRGALTRRRVLLRFRSTSLLFRLQLRWSWLWSWFFVFIIFVIIINIIMIIVLLWFWFWLWLWFWFWIWLWLWSWSLLWLWWWQSLFI